MLGRLSALLLAMTVLLASGCATISGSELQSLALGAKSEQGADLDKVDCELKNNKGQWKTVAPGFVTVQRSGEDLLVTCTKEGQRDGFLRAVSRAGRGMAGNIVFGGGIGALIDHSKGTAYDYPEKIVVLMGQSTVRDRLQDREEEQRQASQSGGQPCLATGHAGLPANCTPPQNAPAATTTTAPAAKFCPPPDRDSPTKERC